MPSGLYPRGSPRPTTSRAEQKLHEALARGLPQGWTAWHSLRIRTRRAFEGEGDFVIAVPRRGAILLEVKGGAIEVRDGRWLQNGKPLPKMPRAQALGFRQTLLNKLKELGMGWIPYLAVAVAFPDTPFSNPPGQGDLQGAVIGQQDLPYIGDALREMAARLLTDKYPPRDAKWIDVLHALWGETWTPRLALGDRVRLREDELVPLDADQLAVLDQVDQNDRLLVTGGPGTGKTLLARDLCARFAARDRKPVLLCSTSALAAGLRADGLEAAWTVRELAADLLEEAGVKLGDGAPRESWDAETWDLAAERASEDSVLAPARERFDAVVVDEAQDLADLDWALVRALAGDRPLWAFMDEGQGFWSDRHCPRALFPASFRLLARYRCPEPLARFADQYREGAERIEPGPLSELRVVSVTDDSALEMAVAAAIQNALDDGARAADIAVLSLAGRERTTLCAGESIGTISVRRADDASATESVIADTFLRFKGLERPWIIVTELGRGSHRYDVRMHVALTRATVGCVLVATAEAIGGDGRLGGIKPTD